MAKSGGTDDAVVTGPLPAVLSHIATVPMDPTVRIVMNNRPIAVPDVVPQLERVASNREEDEESELALSDVEIMDESQAGSSNSPSKSSGKSSAEAIAARKAEELAAERDNYQPFAGDLLKEVRTLPPPRSATGSATGALQRAVKELVVLQESSSPQQLGFYLYVF